MYILDKFSVILEGYHELCQVDESLPRTHVVQNFAKVLHRQWDVKRTPGPAQGAELLFRVLLENEICKCVRRHRTPLPDKAEDKLFLN